MTAWLMRTSYVRKMLQFGIVAVDWNINALDAEDIATVRTLCDQCWPLAQPSRNQGRAKQIWNFVHEMRLGDPLLVPHTTHNSVAVGRVAGSPVWNTDFTSNGRMARSVNWIHSTLAMAVLDPDLLAAIRSSLPIGRLPFSDIEARLGLSNTSDAEPTTSSKSVCEASDGDYPPISISWPGRGTGLMALADVDLAELAREQLYLALTDEFDGDGVREFVIALLKQDGSQIAETSSDEYHVDLVATRADRGSVPWLYVRIIAQGLPALSIVQDMNTIMEANVWRRGMLVSWEGYADDVRTLAAQQYSTIRLRDGHDLIDALLDRHDQIMEEIPLPISLKKVWLLDVSERREISPE